MSDLENSSIQRRQRAPTITIDKAGVSSGNNTSEALDSGSIVNKVSSKAQVICDISQSQDNNGDEVLPQSDRKEQSNEVSEDESQPSQPTKNNEQDRDSRPTSSHNNPQNNISPTSARGDRGSMFLAVPSLRSRQNSIETDEGDRAGTNFSGDTFSNPSLEREGSYKRFLGNGDVIKDTKALSPDPGTESEFDVDPTPFAFSQGQLNKLINPKSLSAFYALGGLAGLEKGLRTDRSSGLNVDETKFQGNISFDQALAAARTAQPLINSDHKSSPPFSTDRKLDDNDSSSSGSSQNKAFCDRKRIYNNNRLPVKKGKSLLQLMWITYNDKVLILLSIAAAVSLAVGLYQTFGTKHDAEHPPIEWVEGLAIIAAIVIVVLVGSLNDWQKERQFVKLNSKKQDRDVNVTRSGKTMELSIYDVLVGDVLHLEPGDMIPVDGIYIKGHNLRCDESQITGESDVIRKSPADQVYAAISNHESLEKLDPFILSGATVTEGVGTFLVTSTGVNSSYGKTLMSLREDPEITPLQSKLNTLAEYIAKLGSGAGLILFVVLFIEFLARLPTNDALPTVKAQQFLQIFIVTVTVIVVAVPEGLPLAVTLALAFATTRMLKDNNLVRHLKACEVMGNATAICSDKTGTLTQNKMQAVTGTLGTNLQFSLSCQLPIDEEPSRSRIDGKFGPPKTVAPQEFVSSLYPEVKTILSQSITINSTAFDGEVAGNKTFIGSKTEVALLTFARNYLGIGPVDIERSNVKIVQLFPFDSARKSMGVVVQLDDGKFRLYMKGAPEILLEKCSTILKDPKAPPISSELTENTRQDVLDQINNYASQSLRVIAFTYRDFNEWPIKRARSTDGNVNDVDFTDVFKKMTLFGFFGLQDPLRDGVSFAVKRCQDAGVVVRMVTGDNMNTAKAIAKECGILSTDGLVMEGPEFRRMNKDEMLKIIPRLQVLARSSPQDKRLLVKRLKDLGETVAVTGDGTNDAPALKTADVGFSMGITGTEVSKEASAIILMDDNFASIVKAMMWGRAVNDAVKKFLQFQVTVNITAVVLTFITAITNSQEESVMTAVQLLWVNLIMDTMAALALATDPPTESILDRKSDPKSAPLISITMWKMIIGESVFQLIVTLILNFGAASIFSYNSVSQIEKIPTLVFNTFVWMQIFNQWNNRRLDNKFNIFEGVSRNYFFIAINVVMVAGQIMIIFVGGKAFNVKRLNAFEWGCSVILGFLSIPLGALIRLIPDSFVLGMIPNFISNSKPKSPRVAICDEEEQFRMSDPLEEVKEELSFLKRVKGGRLNNLRFAIQDKRDQWLTRSRSGSRSRNNSTPQTPNPESQHDNSSIYTQNTPESRRRTRSNRSRSNSALGATAVMAGIIAGSVAGWSPIDRAVREEGSPRFLSQAEFENNDDNRKTRHELG
ncbi:Calcium-transporting ATPase 2 [Erysiphe neolycopersici]|uniref:Calcium-transporting ATPase n=1 Tax=Erysiphe neolycopersici TaxID=212602 RepID=A0A420HXR1_9PEZI|nr:Calcium-transporting ATPase 2 [Erysiphe neolycopersici]